MVFVPSPEDRRRLERWQRRMVCLFVGTWAYIPLLSFAGVSFIAAVFHGRTAPPSA